MDYETANGLIGCLKELDGPICKAIDVADQIDNEEERREIKRALARLIGTIYTKLMIPICIDYPKLLPDSKEI